MNERIEAILFDVGGTLRGSKKKTPAEKISIVEGIVEILETDISAQELARILTERHEAYTRWSRKSHIELDEIGQWTQWFLPDWPAEQISDLAFDLNQVWRQATADRPMYSETREVVLELFNRGYRLGVVSNTVSSTELPDILKDLGISGCFDVVILSCVAGIRKPDPAIMKLATDRMEIDPGKCVYVGNKLDRDVDSSRKAGYSKSIILLDPEDQDQYSDDPSLTPDHYITNLMDLLKLFPPLEITPAVDPVYDASLSTMWASKFPSLVEFFDSARRIGFRKVELNHMIDSDMLSKVDLEDYSISSIHEPCPADISTVELKDRDWMISALEEESRIKGVEAVKRSIDLAHQLGVKDIVVHAGNVSVDPSLENKLRRLVKKGKSDTDEFKQINQVMVEERARLAGPKLEAVRQSLKELLAYAKEHQVRLGLENRYHYYDIPTLPELGELLELADQDQLGFIYDVGHAQTLERLGFYAHEAWLKSFGQRIIGVHFHDVIGVEDHFAPGLGEVDFKMIAPYLPPGAFLTCEVQPKNSPEQVKNGLKYLYEHGCIQRI
jgi:FMN phosphatase YigB (HAD superfamily)/sugar phosphate isomerase/epimerase